MPVRRRQQGLGLVELLVGVAIALILITGATLVYVNSLRASTTSTTLAQVNQALRGMMTVIANDLQRAGYSESAAAGAASNPFTVRMNPAAGAAITDVFVSADQRCILYTFDLDLDGTVDANEFFGFWFDADRREMKVLNQAGGSPVTDTSAVGNCGAYSWQPMNLPATVRVDSATFATGGSQCIAYVPNAYNPASAPGPANFVRWTLDPGQANYRAACDTSVAAGVATPLGLLPAGTAVSVAAAQTGRAEVRQVIVTMRATHARDPAATRELQTTVRLRNDRTM